MLSVRVDVVKVIKSIGVFKSKTSQWLPAFVAEQEIPALSINNNLLILSYWVETSSLSCNGILANLVALC